MKTWVSLLLALALGALLSLWLFAQPSVPLPSSFDEINQRFGDLDDTTPKQEIYLALQILENKQLTQGKEDAFVALVEHYIGKFYSFLGDYEKAISHTQEALNIRQRLIASGKATEDDCERAVHSALNLGKYYFYKPDHDEYRSKSNYQIAANLAKQYAPFFESIAYRQIGNIYERWGDYYEAIDYFKIAQNVAVDPTIQSQAYSAASTSLNFVGKYAAAKACLDTALSLITNDNAEFFVCYQNYGNTYEFQGDYDQAIAYNQKALDFASAHIDQWTVQNALGVLYRKKQQYGQALICLEKAGKIAEMLKDRDKKAAVLDNRGEVYLSQGNVEKALTCFRAAQDTLLNHCPIDSIGYKAGINKVYLFNCIYDEGRAYGQMGNDAAALQAFATADKVLDAMRREQHSETSKLQWREKVSGMYSLALRACFRSGDNEQAFYFIEKSKAAILSDHLAELSANHIIGPQLDSLQQALKNKLSFVSTKPASLETRHQIEQIRHDLEAVEDTISARYPQYAAIRYASSSVTLAALREQMNDTTCLIEYFFGQGAIFALALSKSEGPFLLDLSQKNQLESTLDSLSSFFDGSDVGYQGNDVLYASLAYQTYQSVLAPALGKFKKQYPSAILVPDGKLTKIPFDALITSPTWDHAKGLSSAPFLIYSLQTQLAWSANTLWRFQSHLGKGETALPQLAYFAPGQFPGTDLETLTSSSARLLESAQSALGEASIEAFMDTSANSRRFWQEAPKYAAVHLHTHAAAGGATAPRIYLSGDTLWMEHFYRNRLHADLCLLGACQTNAGQHYTGEGVYSLSRALASTGVPSVISSLWKVPPEATAKIFGFFYKNLHAGMSKANALHLAKKQYLQTYKEPPQNWAAWTFAGRDNTLTIQPAQWWRPYVYWFWGIVLSSIALFLLFRIKKSRNLPS